MAEKKFKWTDQQLRAIKQRGGDVLVSASAGTGKTAVLSGRCADIVSDTVICHDVRSMLVLTFTDAAAEQMRSRIAEQLTAASLQASNDTLRRHLRHQLVLLPAADISTIHSFCKRLITEYFYEIDLDPTFGIIDADEAKLLKTEVLKKTIDWAWQQSNLAQPLSALFHRRALGTNDSFLTRIIELSDFLDGVVSRENWFQKALVLAEADNIFATDLGKRQIEIIKTQFQNILHQVQHAQKLYKEQSTGGWAEKWQQIFVDPVTGYIALLQAGDWEEFFKQIQNFQKPSRYEYKPRDLDGPVAEVIRSTAEGAKKAFEELLSWTVFNPDYLDRIAGSVRLQTRVLIELVRKFDRLYSQAKAAINRLDFADLEHYALKLLIEDSESDELVPSRTALALRRRYKYIFVDEYQDINGVQQAILNSLSSDGNVFVVGDVKQSIYAWRGARPQIFLDRLRTASPTPAPADSPLRVDLTANFRSEKGILDFVNSVFGRIMTSSGFAGLDYDQSAQLKPATDIRPKTPRQGDITVELHILDKTDSRSAEHNEEQSPPDVRNSDVFSNRQHQAAMIAQRIKQMVGDRAGRAEFQIYDKLQDCWRDVEYRDIVILMRSLAKRANDYVEILRLAGVPVSSQATAGYFEATEISDMLCLLKVLDNPLRDIEFAAVLRSPLFNVTDNELAKLKALDKEDKPKKQRQGGSFSGFYDCVLQYSTHGPDTNLADKLNKILSDIDAWRLAAKKENLADLIWKIYRQTRFLSFISALPNGQARRANLLKLHDRAIQFEGFAVAGMSVSLTRFVDFIERLQQAGEDWSPAQPQTEAANAVRIISVHKSKGLEFPVVFLAELESEFSRKPAAQDCLIDEYGTLGLRIIDSELNTRLDSVAYQLIENQNKESALAEEMRILYVATTRARQRLVLTASENHEKCRQVLCHGSFSTQEPIADWQLRRCKSQFEWLLCGLSAQKSLHQALETGVNKQLADDNLFSLKLYKQTELEQLSEFIYNLKAKKSKHTKRTAGKSKISKTDEKLLPEVKRALQWRYQFADAPAVPAKLSVTELSHTDDEYIRCDYSGSLKRKPKAVLAAEPHLEQPAEARLVGAAVHLVLSHLDLDRPVNIKAVEKVIDNLIAEDFVAEAAAKQINTESIVGFFESRLGQMALDADNTVYREWPFTFALPPDEVGNFGHMPEVVGDETIVVQGIIDMLIQTPQTLLIIDFKTDNITAEQVPERSRLYRRQLQFYAMAAGAILKQKHIQKWLYFLTPGSAIETL